jgi:hypothetical protein
MKRMSEIFELPVNHENLEFYGANEKQGVSFCEAEEHAAHAINHVDALADALEGLLNRLHYEGCDFADMAVAATALEKYRGEA